MEFTTLNELLNTHKEDQMLSEAVELSQDIYDNTAFEFDNAFEIIQLAMKKYESSK
jgi:hypothetical protein